MTKVYQAKTLPSGEPNPKYKPKTHKRSGHVKSKFERGHFCAWDGEGVTDKGTGIHRYIMLVNSEGDSMIDRQGLSTRECLDMLCLAGEAYKHAIHVVFGGSYDVNMMLGDCTHEEIASVWAGQWTEVCNGEFVVCYRPRKNFSVRRNLQGYTVVNGKLMRIGGGKSLVLWDVFGFFQSKFTEALNKYLGKDYHRTSMIEQHKLVRSDFTVDELPDILHYCQEECHALVDLMRTLKEYLDKAELKIARWDGAGACAAALLKRQGTVNHKGVSPPAVMEAAQHAYAGGRTELVQYGHAPTTPIYHYDINSAYPTAMRMCPSLALGYWTHERPRIRKQWLWQSGERIPPSEFALYFVEWSFKDDADCFPFFWRAHDTSIYYPSQGSGWYWAPEVAAAFQALSCGAIRGRLAVRECWRFNANADAKDAFPFTWIDTLYTQRRQWKAHGIGAEKVVKLAINSLYGKTAQHLGGTKDKPPRYHQLEWAGFITSYTRATLYTAMLPAISNGNHNAIMMATDAIYSLQPLNLNCGEALGQWTYEPHDGLTVVQSGVYWTYNNGKAKPFCRGFDKGSIALDGVVEAWRDNQSDYAAKLTRFVTMGSALAGASTFQEKWRRWDTTPRMLALSPSGTKRALIANGHHPDRGLVLTQPAIPAAQVVGQKVSAKYPLPWDDNASGKRDEKLGGIALRVIEAEHMESDL